MEFKELRQASGMNKTQFAKYFGIPYRTVQSWELGDRKCPKYLLKLMAYKLVNEAKKKEHAEKIKVAKEHKKLNNEKEKGNR